MKSKASNSLKISWDGPLSSLFKTKNNKSLEKLEAVGLRTVYDLAWITPLRIQVLPPMQDFSYLQEGDLFRGAGTVISNQARPNFWARGKRRALLHNITLVVKDIKSDQTLNLRWFNAYSSMTEKINKISTLAFSGVVQSYQGQLQIINPDISEYTPDLEEIPQQFKVQYPTINKLGPAHLKKVMDKIPQHLWQNIPESLPEQTRTKRDLLNLTQALTTLHARVPISDYSEDQIEKAKERLIYEEFFQEQIKIQLRRKNIKAIPGVEIPLEPHLIKESLGLFSFEFTVDQHKVLHEIAQDMSQGRPMMRLVQGDVGCGKTAVALSCAYQVMKTGHQVAMMCPTESLAFQHLKSAQEVFQDKVSLYFLTGSLKASEKRRINEELAEGRPCLIIGTHALIQESVQIPNLGLAIIDEQHKFGVDQRLRLVHKNKGAHCLIMTATPIPRSLSLTQYGDLDISTIKSMPAGRKGHKTRIVNSSTMEKFLSFFKTRLEMKEQAYVVVPAIEESETHEMENLHQTVEQYKGYFPEYKIQGLHGKMKTEEKMQAFDEFRAGNIDILIATSVIEVGINVANATILAILGPERFGLSSLHQLRGRVGRADKPGFCFLVSEKKLPAESLERLKVIEKNTDGFKIAEEDLRLRGEGDLFGKDQSGVQGARKFASILLHYPILEQVREDIEELNQNQIDILTPYYERLSQDERIFSTV